MGSSYSYTVQIDEKNSDDGYKKVTISRKNEGDVVEMYVNDDNCVMIPTCLIDNGDVKTTWNKVEPSLCLTSREYSYASANLMTSGDYNVMNRIDESVKKYEHCNDIDAVLHLTLEEIIELENGTTTKMYCYKFTPSSSIFTITVKGKFTNGFTLSDEDGKKAITYTSNGYNTDISYTVGLPLNGLCKLCSDKYFKVISIS